MAEQNPEGDEALRISEACRPLFAGKPPVVQGAALADLVSTWLAGHHPSVRAEAFAMWLQCTSELTAVEAQRTGRWPEDRLTKEKLNG
ncbi:MAG TPA: hypothetical protein VD867_05320 [Burkholderiales bacterium]|nr:hypothetical protein [Burkholderiales bacterium]